MASKLRVVRESQKTFWEKKLDARIEVLKGTGLDQADIQRDIVVRKLRSKVKDTVSRLRAIAAREKKLQDMVRIREEKKAAPVVKEKGKKAAPEAPAPKKEKKAKGEKAPKEAKADKEPKAEKKPKADKQAAKPEEQSAGSDS